MSRFSSQDLLLVFCQAIDSLEGVFNIANLSDQSTFTEVVTVIEKSFFFDKGVDISEYILSRHSNKRVSEEGGTGWSTTILFTVTTIVVPVAIIVAMGVMLDCGNMLVRRRVGVALWRRHDCYCQLGLMLLYTIRDSRYSSSSI